MKSVLEPTLVARYGKEGVCVTAPTGLAAQAFGGRTIHSAAGKNTGHGTPQQVADAHVVRARKRWGKVHVIVIEEVSMLSAEFLNKLSAVARILKRVA
jgi:ATP-dependent DNA helicase PIF1